MYTYAAQDNVFLVPLSDDAYEYAIGRPRCDVEPWLSSPCAIVITLGETPELDYAQLVLNSQTAMLLSDAASMAPGLRVFSNQAAVAASFMNRRVVTYSDNPRKTAPVRKVLYPETAKDVVNDIGYEYESRIAYLSEEGRTKCSEAGNHLALLEPRPPMPSHALPMPSHTPPSLPTVAAEACMCPTLTLA